MEVSSSLNAKIELKKNALITNTIWVLLYGDFLVKYHQVIIHVGGKFEKFKREILFEVLLLLFVEVVKPAVRIIN